MNRLIIIILVTFMQSSLVAQEFYGSGAFTEIGFSARSLALGNTMFSDSDPAVAIYFNPAIVTNRNRKSIHFNHRTNNDYFGTYSTFGIYHPIKLSPKGIGINIISYNVGDIEGYDDQANFMGNFDFKEYFGSFIFTSTINNIAWGVKLSGIYNEINKYDKSEFVVGIEIGTTYDLELIKLKEIEGWDIVFLPKVGFTANRYFHPDYYEDNNNFVPTRFSLGANLINIDFTLDALMPSMNNMGEWMSTTVLFTEIYYDLSKKYEYPAESSLGIALGTELERKYKMSFNLGRSNVARDSYNGLSKNLLNELQFDGGHVFFFNSLGFSLDINRFSISYAQTYHPYFNQTDYFSVSLYW